LEGGISSIPKKERQYVEIKRQASIKENLYLLLLKTREETALSYASTVTDSRVLNYPYGIGAPISPNRTRIWLIALALGLLVPVLTILLRESLNYTVQSKKDIEKVMNSPIFGELGSYISEDKNSLVDLSKKGFISEQIRMIRSNLEFILPEKNPKQAHVLLVTSSTSGEGKSFFTANLASAIALLDKRVLVIGLDLRKPKVSQYLQTTNSIAGLSNYLIGNAKMEDIIMGCNLDNVFVIPSGPIPPNPSELISNSKLGELFDIVKHAFDYIIVDTPPVGLVTDAFLVTKFVDASFFIVRHRVTAKLFLESIN
jgi:capsular exopolysaccharide synthesis family protein